MMIWINLFSNLSGCFCSRQLSFRRNYSLKNFSKDFQENMCGRVCFSQWTPSWESCSQQSYFWKTFNSKKHTHWCFWQYSLDECIWFERNPFAFPINFNSFLLKFFSGFQALLNEVVTTTGPQHQIQGSRALISHGTELIFGTEKL